MHEIELKYHVKDRATLVARLLKLNAIAGDIESHEDTYFQHPCRDFAVTTEALRIRKINGCPLITYKGAKRTIESDSGGGIKLRQELEWSLAPGDPDGTLMHEMLERLGFSLVAVVRKQRQPFKVVFGGTEVTVAIDTVPGIGDLAEIEVLADDKPSQELAVRVITQLATQLEVTDIEPRSYLRMALERDESAARPECF